MCGRFTRKYTWREIHDLYRLTVPAAIPNFQPLYNVCPTDPADTIVLNDGQHELVEMRWGLIPYWWSKPLKELRLATFNARVETVTTKPFFREPFKKKRCLMPVSGYYEWEDTPGDHWLNGNMGVDELKPASNDYLQRWAVSKRVNSSKADKDDATLMEPVNQAA